LRAGVWAWRAPPALAAVFHAIGQGRRIGRGVRVSMQRKVHADIDRYDARSNYQTMAAADGDVNPHAAPCSYGCFHAKNRRTGFGKAG
jgi:hypothetical protein